MRFKKFDFGKPKHQIWTSKEQQDEARKRGNKQSRKTRTRVKR